MASVMQSAMQSPRIVKSIADRISNGMSDSTGNSHTPHPILHSPAEQVRDVTSTGTARPDGFVTPGDVLAAGQLGRSETRHPRVRSGERNPIPLHVRAAVWYRDGGRCDEAPCPPTPYWEDPRPTHLDHIQPWSAGGSDTTDNLRLLCETHNLERSNYVDWTRPKRPATWWCHRCHDLAYEVVGAYTLMCPRHPYGWDEKTRCRAARAAKRWQDASWFMVPPPEQYTHIAYCAHCHAPGLTGVLL